MRCLCLLMLLVLLSGCASQQAVFMSEPPGATVTVNGETVGVTPCRLEYQNCSGSSFLVGIEHEGYEPVYREFKADEIDRQARNQWVAAGAVWSPLWIGTLFTNKLKDSYEFILKEEPHKQTAHN